MDDWEEDRGIPPAPDLDTSMADDTTPPPGWPMPPTPPKRVRGRYAKGSSGNPRGRPRERVRPSTERERLREFFAEMERDIEVGGEKIPVTRILLRQRISAAGKGDSKEAGKLLEEYEKNLLKLAEINKEDAAFLEDVERRFGHRESEITDRELLNFLYGLRKKAKKL